MRKPAMAVLVLRFIEDLSITLLVRYHSVFPIRILYWSITFVRLQAVDHSTCALSLFNESIINDFQQPSISSKYQVSYTSIYKIVSYLKPLPSPSFLKVYHK